MVFSVMDLGAAQRSEANSKIFPRVETLNHIELEIEHKSELVCSEGEDVKANSVQDRQKADDGQVRHCGGTEKEVRGQIGKLDSIALMKTWLIFTFLGATLSFAPQIVLANPDFRSLVRYVSAVKSHFTLVNHSPRIPYWRVRDNKIGLYKDPIFYVYPIRCLSSGVKVIDLA